MCVYYLYITVLKLQLTVVSLRHQQLNGFVGNYLHTREGATVTYQCNNGFLPSSTMTAMCANTAKWIPAPEQENCTLFVPGMIS